MHRFLVAAVALSAASCGFGFGLDPQCASCDPSIKAQEALQRDQQAYDSMEAQLTRGRQSFLSKAYSYPRAAGNAFFFYSFPGWDAVLHRFEPVTGQRTDYAFSIGSGADGANYRASERWVVTAQRDGLTVTYIAYDTTQPKREGGRLVVDAPKSEERWWAYAISGDAVFLVTREPDSSTLWLNRWVVGGTLERLFSIQQATHSTLGEFLDFDVDGDTLVFIEGGRLWRGSIANRTAQWLHNEKEISGSVDFSDDAVLWEGADGLHAFWTTTGQSVDVSKLINESSYRFNDTFPTIHRYDGDFTRWQDWVVYEAASGIFAFHLKSMEIRPVVLAPRVSDVRITYRYPVALKSGALFVTGLESSSGSVGADGPIYRVDLAAALQVTR